MIETKDSLLATTKEILSIPSSDTSKNTQLLKLLNHRRRLIIRKFSDLGWVVRSNPDSYTTVAGTGEYSYKPTAFPPFEAATYNGNGIDEPMEIIESQTRWNALTQVPNTSSTPKLLLPKRDSFLVYPTPGAAADTIKLYGSPLDQDLTLADYTTGTIALTAGDKTVEGSGVTWVTTWKNMWIKVREVWMEVDSFTDTDTLELKREATDTVSGLTYTIGQVPNVPVELLVYLPYGAAADYLGGAKGATPKAQKYLNYFYTGDFDNSKRRVSADLEGLIGAMARYSNRGGGAVVQKSGISELMVGEEWGILLSNS